MPRLSVVGNIGVGLLVHSVSNRVRDGIHSRNLAEMRTVHTAPNRRPFARVSLAPQAFSLDEEDGLATYEQSASLSDYVNEFRLAFALTRLG